MKELLKNSELFSGMEEGHLSNLLEVARKETFPSGKYLFLLGGHADRLFVVLEGRIETCFPLSFGGAVKDVAVEPKTAGSALGWSALVKPHQFTLSARAAERSTVAAFHRQDLLAVLESDCSIGQAFMGRLAEIMGRRLLTIQALWARELQRAVAGGWAGLPFPATRP
ncbi:MAG: cyclic nucleotide-binding domain-containing protein [Planctomycetota bacterium]